MTAAHHSPDEYRAMQAVYARAPGLRQRFATLGAALADSLAGKTLRIAARAIAKHPRKTPRPQPQLPLIED